MAYLGKDAYASYSTQNSSKAPAQPDLRKIFAPYQKTSQGARKARNVESFEEVYTAPAVEEKKKSGGNSGGSNNKSSAPTPTTERDIWDQQNIMAKDIYDQNLSDSLLALDKNKALAEQQISSLETSKATDQSILEQALRSVLTQAGTTKSNLYNQAEAATEQGASAARQATTKTRNTLRGLGILSSSAAGDLLSRPGTEFQKVSADVQTQLSQGVKQIDDFVTSKTEENALKVQQLLQQYTDLIGRIQTDLRFSDRERLSAVKQAGLARDQMLSEIRANQTNYQLQAQTLKNNLLSEWKGIGDNTIGNVETAKEKIAKIQPVNVNPQSTTVGADIINTQRKKLPGLA